MPSTRCNFPIDWTNAVVVLIHKKEDVENLDSLLSKNVQVVFKINRMLTKLDFYMPVEQVAFRICYSTMEHLQSVRILTKKTAEYYMSIWMAFLGHRKGLTR